MRLRSDVERGLPSSPSLPPTDAKPLLSRCVGRATGPPNGGQHVPTMSRAASALLPPSRVSQSQTWGGAEAGSGRRSERGGRGATPAPRARDPREGTAQRPAGSLRKQQCPPSARRPALLPSVGLSGAKPGPAGPAAVGPVAEPAVPQRRGSATVPALVPGLLTPELTLAADSSGTRPAFPQRPRPRPAASCRAPSWTCLRGSGPQPLGSLLRVEPRVEQPERARASGRGDQQDAGPQLSLSVHPRCLPTLLHLLPAGCLTQDKPEGVHLRAERHQGIRCRQSRREPRTKGL